MVLDTTRYNATYFGDTVESGGLKDVAGYTGGYLEKGQRYRFNSGDEANPYNPEWKALADVIHGRNPLNNADVLDLGGAVGFLGEYLKEKGASTYDVIDVSNWCFKHKLSVIDTFTENDAITALQSLRDDAYSLIISTQFLECVDDTDLPTLITEMNRVANNVQIHVVTETLNREDTRSLYNLKTLKEWSAFGFNSGTILISHHTGDVLVV